MLNLVLLCIFHFLSTPDNYKLSHVNNGDRRYLYGILYFISNDCNLNCSYCSILLKKGKGNIPQEPAFSVAELNNFIDKTQRKYNDKSADIVFFGGEPTLNYPFIEKIISSQDSKFEKPYEYHYMLHTNGLLLGEIPDNILKHLDSIMLSINYDKIPRLKLNEGYFKTIINSVRIVKQRKSIVCITCA